MGIQPGKTELTIEPDGKKINSSKKSGLDTDYILKYNYGEGELLSPIILTARGERGNVFGEERISWFRHRTEISKMVRISLMMVKHLLKVITDIGEATK